MRWLCETFYGYKPSMLGPDLTDACCEVDYDFNSRFWSTFPDMRPLGQIKAVANEVQVTLCESRANTWKLANYDAKSGGLKIVYSCWRTTMQILQAAKAESCWRSKNRSAIGLIVHFKYFSVVGDAVPILVAVKNGPASSSYWTRIVLWFVTF